MPPDPALRVTHVTHELAPHHALGGLGIAAGRLVEQLERAGARSRVIFRFPAEGRDPMAAFIERALRVLEDSPPTDDEPLVVHEAAALVPLARGLGGPGRLVYWLHSLYDTPLPSQLPSAWRHAIGGDSALASAIDAADLIVTSAGVLADAHEVAWSTMAAVQAALLRAIDRRATRSVEAYQCLPFAEVIPSEVIPSERPRVLFPSRVGVHKGSGLFLAIVDRLAHLDVEFMAIGEPARAKIDPARPGVERVRWIPWLAPAEFRALLASATCVVVPSLHEGFGLAAAEAAAAGAPLIVQDIGGLRSLCVDAATRVELTPAERTSLYALWGALRLSSDHWACWDAATPRLAGLIDRWTEQVEAALTRPAGRARTPIRLGPPDAPSWGQALLDWTR